LPRLIEHVSRGSSTTHVKTCHCYRPKCDRLALTRAAKGPLVPFSGMENFRKSASGFELLLAVSIYDLFTALRSGWRHYCTQGGLEDRVATSGERRTDSGLGEARKRHVPARRMEEEVRKVLRLTVRGVLAVALALVVLPFGTPQANPPGAPSGNWRSSSTTSPCHRTHTRA